MPALLVLPTIQNHVVMYHVEVFLYGAVYVKAFEGQTTYIFFPMQVMRRQEYLLDPHVFIIGYVTGSSA